MYTSSLGISSQAAHSPVPQSSSGVAPQNLETGYHYGASTGWQIDHGHHEDRKMSLPRSGGIKRGTVISSTPGYPRCHLRSQFPRSRHPVDMRVSIQPWVAP